ncbi:MAG: hypothetical protein FJ090_19350 [Deltaproteobacteria bacterium]|nr:hypothetical protein [Deltaproteobacteria bacterium]
MNLKTSSALTAIAIVLAFATPARAHRTDGLLQASLVEVLPTQIGVEVTLAPGIDIAPKIIAVLDLDRDGVFSEIESEAWSELFMAKQRVTVDGESLPLKLQSVRATPLAELTNGHAEIVVYFTADLGQLAHGPHTLTCANHYEPMPSIYQCNGLVPKAPSVRITSHRRDERQRELTLAAEFFPAAGSASHTARSTVTVPQPRRGLALLWLGGLGLAGVIAAAIFQRSRRSGRNARVMVGN